MKTKGLILSFLTVISIIIVAVLVIGTHTVSPTTLKFTSPITQLSFTLTPPSTSTSYTLTFPTITQDDGVNIAFTFSGDLTDINTSQTITINSTNVNYGKLSPGKNYNGNLVITNTADSSDRVNVPVSFVGSFCKNGEIGTDLEITKVTIDNADGDDDQWTPLDEIDIEVEVSNEGQEKVKEVHVELGLFDSQGKNVIKDMDDLDNEEIDVGSIKDDDEDTAVFTFKVPADFETDNYKLVVKAFSDDLGEETLCIAHSSDLDEDFFQTIDGEREEDEDKHIVFHKINVSPAQVQCKERVQVAGEVINIGDTDYEDQVRVNIFNQELGVNLDKVVKKDFDQGDFETVDFEFLVPDKVEEKIYTLDFTTYYDYDTDDNTYDVSSQDKFTGTVRVQGNCEQEDATKDVRITAELDTETPEAVAGKQVIVNAELENTGDTETTYSISVLGNSAWSSVVSVDPQTVTLTPGESREVNIVLRINSDASGDKEFTIKTSFENQTTEQKVAFSISPSETTNPQLGPFVESIRSNWFIYLIIIINIILIIAIILVIRSMVSPRAL